MPLLEAALQREIAHLEIGIAKTWRRIRYLSRNMTAGSKRLIIKRYPLTP